MPVCLHAQVHDTHLTHDEDSCTNVACHVMIGTAWGLMENQCEAHDEALIPCAYGKLQRGALLNKVSPTTKDHPGRHE